MFPKRKQFIEYVVIVAIALVLTFWFINDPNIFKHMIASILGLLSPFIIGFVLAYLLNTPVKYLTKKTRFNRNMSIAFIYVSLIALIIIVSVLLAPSIANNILGLINDISAWTTQIPDKIATFDFGNYEEIIQSQTTKFTEVLTGFTNSILQNIVDLLVNITTTFFNIILGIIISIYMLIDKKKLSETLKKLTIAILKPERAHQLFGFLAEVDAIFSHFLVGLIVEAIIVGILATIGFSIMGVKYAIILGLIICITNMIPYFGAFIGAIPAILTAGMYDPIKAIWVAVFIIVLQQVDGNLIGPRIMGNYIGLDPIWIILAITVGGGIGGLLGMVLAIPTGAIIKLIIVRVVDKRMTHLEKDASE